MAHAPRRRPRCSTAWSGFDLGDRRARSSARPATPTASALYEVVTCTADGGPVRTSAGFDVAARPRAARSSTTADTVIIPGIHGDPAPARRRAVLAEAARRSPRIRPRRPAGVDLHRRVRARRGRAARRPPRDHPLGVRRRVPAAASRGCVLDQNVLFVDDGDVLTSAGLARRSRPVPAPDSRATTAARWPTRWPDTAWCRRGATAARRSSSSGTCRRAPTTSTGAGPRSGRCEHLDEALDLAALAGTRG